MNHLNFIGVENIHPLLAQYCQQTIEPFRDKVVFSQVLIKYCNIA